MSRPVPGLFFPIAAILLTAAIAIPILALLVSVSPREFAVAFAAPAARDAVRVSLLASSIATACATLLGVPGGYWLARAPRRVGAAILFVLALPLAFPPIASGILLLSALRFTPLPDSLAGVAAAEFFVSGSFVAIASAAAFAALDQQREDAARTLGV